MIVPIVAVLSVLVAGLGLYGVVSPPGLMSFATRWQSKSGLWVASILRMVFGIALWLVAPSSRVPVVLQALAVVSVVSGVALPLVGFSRYHAFLAWWSRQSPLFVRAWCLVALVLGLFVLWSVVA